VRPGDQLDHRATVIAQESAKEAHAQWRVVSDQLRDKIPRLGDMMDSAEHEALSYMDFPRAHWLQIHSTTNRLERLNAEIKRRTNVVGIFPNDRAIIIRLVGAMLLEQSDEWPPSIALAAICDGYLNCRGSPDDNCIRRGRRASLTRSTIAWSSLSISMKGFANT
jgi:transposase-like protein